MTGWSAVRLGEVAEFVRGVTFKPADVVPVGTAGSVACMRTKNVQDALEVADVWAIPKGIVKRDEQYLTEGDTLVSSANSWNLVGKCCWVPGLPWRSTFGGFVSVLRARSADVSPRFLYRWFSSGPAQATVRSFGNQTTNISNLNIERCLAMQTPLPPLPEQVRIAEILDRADALRARRRAALAQVDGLTQAIFLAMFGDPATNPRGWPIRQTGEVSDVQGGLQVSASRRSAAREVPYLRVANVYRGRLDLTEIKSIRASESEIARTALRENDLLLVEGHGNPEEIGRCALWDGSIPECVHQNHLIRARFAISVVEPAFACEYLNSFGGRRHLLRSGKTTSGLNTINVSEVKAAPIPVPPLDLQRSFTRRAVAVDKLKAAHRASLAQLDALFAALQFRAFRGEL